MKLATAILLLTGLSAVAAKTSSSTSSSSSSSGSRRRRRRSGSRRWFRGWDWDLTGSSKDIRVVGDYCGDVVVRIEDFHTPTYRCADWLEDNLRLYPDIRVHEESTCDGYHGLNTRCISLNDRTACDYGFIDRTMVDVERMPACVAKYGYGLRRRRKRSSSRRSRSSSK